MGDQDPPSRTCTDTAASTIFKNLIAKERSPLATSRVACQSITMRKQPRLLLEEPNLLDVLNKIVQQREGATPARVKVSAEPAIYQFKITLRHTKPAIWRRIHVSNELTLGQFHAATQAVMGWQNSHLHSFTIQGTSFGAKTDPMGDQLGTEDLDEDEFELRDLRLRARSKFGYMYDFGDSWDHEILLEKVLAYQPGFSPCCIKGERACPPEDCGGVWGYYAKLEALSDRNHPEHDEVAEWMDPKFEAKKFDLTQVNLRLKRLANLWKKTRK